jgi:hypothetical protein
MWVTGSGCRTRWASHHKNDTTLDRWSSLEVRQHDQYTMKDHGSGWVTLRNRMFLCRYTPYVNIIP